MLAALGTIAVMFLTGNHHPTGSVRRAVKSGRPGPVRAIAMRCLPLLVLLSLSGCAAVGAPSFVLFGTFFPAWMFWALFAAFVGATRPSSNDASIDADIVHIAAAVGGRIIRTDVVENARVAKGAFLFQIDPVPCRLAVDQASADLAIAEAQLATQRHILSTRRSTAVIAADQTRTARANDALATRTVARLRPLAAKGYVRRRQLDDAEVAARDAATALRQAQEQQVAALRAIDTEQAAEAAVDARKAALALTGRGLADTTVRAPHAVLVVGLTASSGEKVAPGQALFNLINMDAWFAVADFRETDLHAIAASDCATVYSMIDDRRPIKAIVQGIGWGILDQDRITLPRALPYVERSLSRVRVPQRSPVRIRLENPPPALMRLGASAVVEIRHGHDCH